MRAQLGELGGAGHQQVVDLRPALELDLEMRKRLGVDHAVDFQANALPLFPQRDLDTAAIGADIGLEPRGNIYQSRLEKGTPVLLLHGTDRLRLARDHL